MKASDIVKIKKERHLFSLDYDDIKIILSILKMRAAEHKEMSNYFADINDSESASYYEDKRCHCQDLIERFDRIFEAIERRLNNESE